MMAHCYDRRAAINPCGRLSLITGKNLHFNVLTEWDERSTLTLVQEEGSGRLRVIGGWGEFGQEIGSRIGLRHSQNFRDMGNWIVGRSFPCTEQGLADLREHLGRGGVTFCTFD